MRCGCNGGLYLETDEWSRAWAVCRACGYEQHAAQASVFAPGPSLSYTRPNTGNHPDHPPVEGGYRGDRD